MRVKPRCMSSAASQLYVLVGCKNSSDPVSKLPLRLICAFALMPNRQSDTYKHLAEIIKNSVSQVYHDKNLLDKAYITEQCALKTIR